ncbi:MAG TPA: helix-turn-helix transcriptional regulator [Steroidobacteraceae bacterium]|jgi:transcriptional regulator with XRE-family HTH domain|nr:helix-turn-helix transcriptional regulator [Steroidobacteraceae bacterium]
MPSHDSNQAAADEEPRPSLGDFLRARRDRLRPEDFGLPLGRRRAPGLRREEAAQLCAISPTWYTWIEQGRTTAVSVATLSAIAAGLRLSRAERTYLFELSARADPARPPTQGDSDPQQLSALVDAVMSPAYVLDRHWDAIAWNRPAAELFADWLGSSGRPAVSHAVPGDGTAERNLLRYVFLDDRAPAFIVDWSERARRLVAEYRADSASWVDDPVRQALVHELCAASTAFESAWRSHQVLSREGGRRGFQHRERGYCTYEQYTLRVAQRPELKLTILLPSDAQPTNALPE